MGSRVRFPYDIPPWSKPIVLLLGEYPYKYSLSHKNSMSTLASLWVAIDYD